MAAVYFNDLVVGQQFRSSMKTLTRDRLVAFAVEFDPQPQHLGEEEARGSHFGTLVASGWHTAALTMGLQIEAFFGRVPGGGIGAQIDRLSWRRPVHPGDQLYVVIEVLALRGSRSRPTMGVASLRTITFNQGDEPVMEMEAAVLLPRQADVHIAQT